MRNRSGARLKDRRTGELVYAAVIDGVSREEVETAEAAWQSFLRKRPKSKRAIAVPEHAHWDWRTKHRATQGIVAYRMFGIDCAGEMQGLMLVVIAGHACRIDSQKGKDLVYVDFVATAPWNSPLLVRAPRYGLVGRVFIATAIQLSMYEGFQGRIGLHSLPQAETFYAEQCGMIDLGIDTNKEGLRYFEMTGVQARDFLR